MARRSAGGVVISDRSRSPPSAMFSVRGMGVAVSVSTCTSARSVFRRSLSRTPKRCSSSTMIRPEILEAHVGMQQAVRGDDDVDRAVLDAFERRLAIPCRCRNATAIRCAPASPRSGRGNSRCAARRAASSAPAPPPACPPARRRTPRAWPLRSCRSRRRRRPCDPWASRSRGRRSTWRMASAWSAVSSNGKAAGEGLVFLLARRQLRAAAAPGAARTDPAAPRPRRGSGRRRACAPWPTDRCRACAAARSRARRRYSA